MKPLAERLARWAAEYTPTADDYEQITYGVHEHIATLRLNRPEARNGYTVQMSHELPAAFARADADPQVRVVVLTAEGPTFCVGAGPGSPGRQGPGLHAHRGPGARRRRGRGPLPGARRPGDLGDAPAQQAGDRRRARRRRRCRFHPAAAGRLPAGRPRQQVRLSVHPARHRPRGRVVLVPAPAGRAHRRPGLDGRRAIVPATEALDAGLLTSLHEENEVLDAAHDLARALAAHTAPVPVALTRQMLYRMAWADSPADVHRLDSRLIHDLTRGPDAAEGVRSFFERRPPAFGDRVPDDLPDRLPWAATE